MNVPQLRPYIAAGSYLTFQAEKRLLLKLAYESVFVLAKPRLAIADDPELGVHQTWEVQLDGARFHALASEELDLHHRNWRRRGSAPEARGSPCQAMGLEERSVRSGGRRPSPYAQVCLGMKHPYPLVGSKALREDVGIG